MPGRNGVEAKVSYGHPAEVLIDESADADLLVVGHRGHGGFSGMHIGSVSIHCVNAAPRSACVSALSRGQVIEAESVFDYPYQSKLFVLCYSHVVLPCANAR